MNRRGAIGTLIGLGLATMILADNDIASIFGALERASWGILLVVALHIPQILFSTFGWRALIISDRLPDFWILICLRWVRESANALLPMAQIGGDFVRARLLTQCGVHLKGAVASTMVDLSVEMTAQIVFTLFSVGLLLMAKPGGNAIPIAIAASSISGVIAISFMASQRLGVFELFERAINRSSVGKKWAFLGELSGLNEAVVSLYRQPRRIWSSGLHHLISWALGAVETQAALHVLRLKGGLREAVVIEGLSQAVRGVAFFVPGALGVQEGGYLVICAMFAITPQNALALSLIRRIRELTLGIPGLLLWYSLERNHRSWKTSAAEVTPP